MKPVYHQKRPGSQVSKSSTANPLAMYNMEEYSSILKDSKYSISKESPIKRTVYVNNNDQSKSRQSMEYSLANPIQMKVYSIPRLHDQQ